MRESGDVPPIEHDAPGGSQLTGDELEEGALARAVRPDHRAQGSPAGTSTVTPSTATSCPKLRLRFSVRSSVGAVTGRYLSAREGVGATARRPDHVASRGGMFPYRDENETETQRTPYITLAFIALNVLVWLVVQGAGATLPPRAVRLRASGSSRGSFWAPYRPALASRSATAWFVSPTPGRKSPT